MSDLIRRYALLLLVVTSAAIAFADPSGPDKQMDATTQPSTAPAALPGLDPGDFDFKQLLGDPPARGSDAEKAEFDRLIQLQKSRTPEEIQRCKDEVNVTPFAFAAVIGDWFTPDNLPETDKLMKIAVVQTKPIFTAAKALWGRKRPYMMNDAIQPCVAKEKGASYPSGHATRGVVWATIFAQIFPQDKQPIMAFGREIGDDRALAGMHFPSDVMAGQKLGAEIARRLLADPTFQKQLAKAKAECAAKEPVKAN